MLNPVNCVESVAVNFMYLDCCLDDKLSLKTNVVVLKVLVYETGIKNFLEKSRRKRVPEEVCQETLKKWHPTGKGAPSGTHCVCECTEWHMVREEGCMPSGTWEINGSVPLGTP